MKALVFDSGPIINLALNNMLWILKPLKEKFKGDFYITESVKRECIDRPLTSKKFKYEALETFKEKWDKKYPSISKSWEKNWVELSTFFKYPQEIRTLIYTTNPIESLNRGLKKISKTRSVFPNEDAIFKLLYLAVNDISKRWTQRIRNWGAIHSQLCIFFEERLSNYI